MSNGTLKKLRSMTRVIVHNSAGVVTASDAINTPSTSDENTLRSIGFERSWANTDGRFSAIGQSHASLPQGLYESRASEHGYYLQSIDNNLDEVIDLPDSESERLLDEVVQFRSLKDSFTEHGFLYKRGILLWGPPGSGKTVTIQQLIKLFVTDGGGVAIMVKHPSISLECLRMLRKIEPDRQILAILEDLDALVDEYDESQYLALLDGEAQLQNICFVATTNYPERLDKRFTDRPSRFDTIRYIGMPTAEARAAYMRAKAPALSEDEVQNYIKETDGFSIAYLREAIVLTQCFKMPFEDAIARLRKMHAASPKSSATSDTAFGFS